MVLILSIASLALAAISVVSGRVVPRKTAPSKWDCELEPYDQYHHRYLSFDCQDHHGTQYFDQCCHPRLANETSLPFPSQCGCDDDDDDTSSPSNSTQITPTPTDVEPTSSPQPEQSSEPSSSTPTPSPTTSDDNGNDDNGSDDNSNNSGDNSQPSSSTPTPTPTPSPVSYSSNPSDGNGDNNGSDNNSQPSSSTSSTPTPTPTSSSDNSNGNSDVHTGGEATFFYQDGNPGACGQVHSDSDFICAMDQDLFGTSGPSSPLCGKQVTITNTANGKTVTVTVADDCPTCSNANSIDLSKAAFDQIGSESDGVLPISWYFS
jgi:hypothetical protein